MEVKKFIMGNMETNSFVAFEDGKAVLFDIGSKDISPITNFIEENSLELESIIFTHGHFDHIMGINEMIAYTGGIDIYIGKEDYGKLYNPSANLSSMVGDCITLENRFKAKFLNEGDKIFGFDIFNSPGHTKGGRFFYHQDSGTIIAGDTIFKNGMGRTDFPGGDFEEIMKSINRILEFPEETKLYTGHGAETTVKDEKDQHMNI